MGTHGLYFLYRDEKGRKLTDALTSEHHFEQAGFKTLLRGVAK
uniref:Uncharacterized protein n=1 Tax=Candidatus Kentrum sp. SD TaxID=2126332 RepID=A0A450Z772_9GAMM|nr:MAG: hypothetical protein BECKSD772F_GA0070984_12058 [Candidatus Kentron sp. SD]VFK49643.1 MAG: hypothetical protein BECKSD772E_GA0070983_12078 [Candidatus Kentron sp. SD]VFK80949.1 MAG: hypothetical protein BECKSD772D_GA0070982_11833 [Candidatus Kentron sp. SD]